jgi:shikimate dehydrogenase
VTSRPQRLAVLGSPIAHSQSPALQRAAYEVLGLDWSYEAVEVTEDALPHFIRSRDDTWRGLSLTMPLKRDVLPLLDRSDELVGITGSANTVLFSAPDAGARREVAGFNTDVYGITEAFRQRGHVALGVVQILGAGATAASAVVAASRLGAHTVYLCARSAERATQLSALVGPGIGQTRIVLSALDANRLPRQPDAVISTLPNGTDISFDLNAETMRSATLLDVAYHPWPSALASVWKGEVISGLEMLVLQALAQVRIFVSGDAERVLDAEPAVLRAMKASVGL